MGGHSTIVVGGKLGATLAHFLPIHTNNPIITTIAAPNPHTPEINYEFIAVPDTAAANVVFVNDTIVRRAACEFPLSDAIFREKVPGNIRQVEVEAGELAKVDGALSCCSVLF